MSIQDKLVRRMCQPEADDGLASLLRLISISSKREVERQCRGMQITSDDFFHLLIAARDTAELAPYRYACHFVDIAPPHLFPNERDNAALTGGGIGSSAPGVGKFARKIFQLFKERRAFAAHLLFTPGGRYWHLFYFDQRDTEVAANHWRGGSHIHYSGDTFTNDRLDIVWERVRATPPALPPSVHIRYRQVPGGA